MPNIYAFTEGPAQEPAALSSQEGLQLPTSQSQSPPPNTHTSAPISCKQNRGLQVSKPGARKGTGCFGGIPRVSFPGPHC